MFALHIGEGFTHDSLSHDRATVHTLHGHFVWLLRMGFSFRVWLTALLVALALCFARSPFASGKRWPRPSADWFAAIHFMNEIMHPATKMLGRTAPSVRFPRVAPGFCSASLLLARSAYLFWSLRRTAGQATDPARA
jgi:hypothetical protein